MKTAPQMRSPATALHSGDGAGNQARNGFPFTIPEPEVNFAALYLARRYRLSPCLAQAVAVLAGLGRALA